jgi:CPA1 family monovalent cation:H+ antiporter
MRISEIRIFRFSSEEHHTVVMVLFEWTLILLVCAVALTAIARHGNVPYPSLLALGGTALALVPNAPSFTLDPDLTLSLFVAPVLLDAAFDTSVRDLKRAWIPVTCLVLIAVGLTTIGVAYVARALVPDMPWAAAVALGAIVAPPDAAAATAVLKRLRLPHRLMVILEGESLLNDASALLIYRLAVASVAANAFSVGQVAPAFALGVIGSVIAGFALAWAYMVSLGRVQDTSSAIVLQFAGTFGVWILAERIGLSPIVTVVAYAVTVARQAPKQTPARIRVPSYAVWETVVFILNVLAFVLIGLQLRPILDPLDPAQRLGYFQLALAVFVGVVLIRFGWIIFYVTTARIKARLFGAGRWPGEVVPTLRSGLVVSWCGMRGVVTLAAAYALPLGFPYRDVILLCAFSVVVGTLVMQGLTLRPLILWLKVKGDEAVEEEIHRAYTRILNVALAALDGKTSAEAQALRHEFSSSLDTAKRGRIGADHHSGHDQLRALLIAQQRQSLFEMRASGEIGDDAFHEIEARLDWAELNARGIS